MKKLLCSLFLLLIIPQAFSQEVNGSMIFNRGVNVSFNLFSINNIKYGLVRTDYTIVSLDFEDLAGGTDYTGFALYAQALTPEVEGTVNNFPLKKIKMTCSGNEVSNVTYVSDTSEVNSKLSASMTPICYWETTPGAARSDQVKITYYLEPLLGFDSDNYFVEIDLTLRSYTGAP